MDYTQRPWVFRRAWKAGLYLLGWLVIALHLAFGPAWLGMLLVGLGGVFADLGQALIDSGALTFLLVCVYLAVGVATYLYLGTQPDEDEPFEKALERFRLGRENSLEHLAEALGREGAQAPARLAAAITRDLDLDRALELVSLAPRYDGEALQAKLRELIGSPNERMAVAALEAWLESSDPARETRLIQLLDHESEDVVLAALRGLRRLKPPAAGPAIEALLAGDPSRSVRDAGVEVLQALGTPRRQAG